MDVTVLLGWLAAGGMCLTTLVIIAEGQVIMRMRRRLGLRAGGQASVAHGDPSMVMRKPMGPSRGGNGGLCGNLDSHLWT